MTRENLENQEGESESLRTGLEAPGDIELTAEDRERIGSYLNLREWGNLSSESRELVYEKLRQEGRKAAFYILEKLDQEINQAEGSEQDFPPVDVGSLYYRHINCLSHCATAAESKKLGQILVRDAIALDHDRSSKCAIMAIFQGVGTEEAAEYLKIFSDKSFSTNYGEESGRFISYDNLEILATLRIILSRTPEDKKHIVEEAISRVEENTRNRSLTPYLERQLNFPRRREENYNIYRERSSIITRNYFEERTPLARYNNSLDEEIGRAELRSFFQPREELSVKNDEEEDEEITEAYLEQRLLEAEERLQIVKNLRHEIKEEKKMKGGEPEEDDTKFLRRHYLEYREKNPSALAPTLGIEIEIREATVLPERLHLNSAPGWSTEEGSQWREERDKAKEKYRKTEKLGVPYGGDKFWEFSHKPVRHYLTLSREVQALIEMGLINKTDQKHPLHLTIGGITSDMTGGGEEAFLLARVLEASAWSVRGRRLLRPFYSKMNVWGCKGEAGGKDRLPGELQIGAKRGVEIRTFQLQSLAGLDRLLRSSYLLGAALKSWQEENHTYKKNKKDKPERKRLAEIWSEFSLKTEELFKKFNLADPKNIWTLPYSHDKDQKSEFWTLARLIDEAEADPKSQGAEFVKEVRELIIKMRAIIAKIIYPKIGKIEGNENQSL